ncbi:Carbamoyltransferase hypF [Yokenella regensburgei]|nr:Carbamoyltransferase hypF [Yokenella regensburgei]
MRASGEMLRRARGFVPDALPLPPGFHDVPPLLCLGADMKNTFCLVRGEQAVLSQHFGDVDDDGVEQQWRQALTLMQRIYDFTPQQVVVDAHPGFRSTRWAASLGLPQQTVLHHHAHAAACLAEHQWPLDGGDVIALTLDGIGMGEGGALWGGECLRVNYRDCQRLGGLPAVALPGGELAARQPWRNLLAQCLAFIPYWQQEPELAVLHQHNWPPLANAVARALTHRWRRPAGGCLMRLLTRRAAPPIRRAMKGRRPVASKRWRCSVQASITRCGCRIATASYAWLLSGRAGCTGRHRQIKKHGRSMMHWRRGWR